MRACAEYAQLLEMLRARALPAGADAALLMEQACAQKVVPQAYSAIPAEKITADFGREYLRRAGHSLLVFREAKALTRALEKKGVDFAFTKGINIAKKQGCDIARETGDIDLFIKKEDIPKIERVIYGLGWAAHFDYQFIKARRLRSGCQLPAFGKNGILLDLHWGLSDYAEVEPRELWGSAREFSFEGAKALELSPEEQALYLCSHSALSHGLEFIVKDLADLDSVISLHARRFRWDEFAEKAKKRRVSAISYFCLLNAKNGLGTEIPAETLSTLKKNSCRAEMLAIANLRRGGILRFCMRFMHAKGAMAKARFLLLTLFPPEERLVCFFGARADRRMELLLLRVLNPLRLAAKPFMQ